MISIKRVRSAGGSLGEIQDVPVPRPTLFAGQEGSPTKVGADQLNTDLKKAKKGIKREESSQQDVDFHDID
jgi:hypothetical protein